MCRHIRYMFVQCPHLLYKYASDKETPICIRPCSKAVNDKGELDHAKFTRCPNFTVDVVNIRSGCTMRCAHCINMASSLPPDDPRFEFLIEQPNGITMHCFGSTLPRLEEMTWYIPERGPMNDSHFRPFSWTGSRKRKADGSDDDTLIRGAEPLSPKAFPATPVKVSDDSPSTTPEEPGWLTKHLCRPMSKLLAPAPITSTTDASASAEHERVPALCTASSSSTAELPASPPVPLSFTSQPIVLARGRSNSHHAQRVSETRVALQECGNARAAAFGPGFRFGVARADKAWDGVEWDWTGVERSC